MKKQETSLTLGLHLLTNKDVERLKMIIGFYNIHVSFLEVIQEQEVKINNNNNNDNNTLSMKKSS